MCGIFGAVAWRGERPDVDRLRRTTNLLRHRGPDGGGYWSEDGVFLGHRRLAIIDLDTGAQPMATTDGRFVITFNGEIYNYAELREELGAAGAAFRTRSDTEVILEGYAAWGTDVVRRLEGMFAFALYDRRDGSVLLARDRFGEKPLLCAAGADGLVFASELAPIAATLGRGEIDRDALAAYLCLNYVPGTRTLRRGIERVAPGEWRRYDARGEVRRTQYWTPAASIETRADAGRDALVDELQRRVDHGVRRTLVSDVPVGLFLSGGTDSSIVAESAARQGHLAAAFCVDVGERGFSEWEGASFVARRLGIPLERVRFDPAVLDEFLDVAAHLDDPLADSSAMAVWTVARGAARQVKVVLSGDGGDELFGGYLTYPASAWHAHASRFVPARAARALAALAAHIPADDAVKVGAGYKAQRFLRALPLATREAHFTWNGTWLPAEAAALLREEDDRARARGALRALADRHQLAVRPSTLALQLADAADYLPNDILSKVDRATMAHGLESRAPLLNPAVASFAFGLPERWRIGRVSSTKRLLRALAARHYGAAHAHAPKQGFSIPIHQWLRGAGRRLLTDLLAPDRVGALGVLDPAAVTRAVNDHLERRRLLGWELWGLMVLITWFERRVADVPSATEPVMASGV